MGQFGERTNRKVSMEDFIPTSLAEIIQDFQFCEGREKIELLIDYAESLPPLPDWLSENHEKLEQVPECMTPVFIQSELQNGKLIFYFDVPPESPTVRGYASIVKKGLDGSTPEEVLRIPGDFFHAMGLQEVLTYQRLNGLSAILAHIKQLAAQAIKN